MKQKLKRLRPWLLSVTALLLLVNCAEELALPTNLSTEGDAARHKILHGREAAAKKNDLVAHLKQPGGRGMANLAAQLGSSPNFRKLEDVAYLIDSTEVYEIKFENGDTNYTYRFNDPKANDASFYNIVLKRRGTTSKSVIIHYEMETAFVDEFYSGSKGIEGMTGNIHFEPLGADEGFPCEEEPNIPIPINGGMGPGGGGGNGPGTGPITIGEGVYGVGTNYGYSYNQVVVTMQYMALYVNTVYVIHKSPRNLRVPAIDPGLAGPNDPCGGEDEIGILEPELPDPHEKNCEELKKMLENTQIKNALNHLRSSSIMNQQRENGYSFRGDTSTETAEALPPGPLYGSSIDIPTGGNRYGAGHTHQNDGKSIPMFSSHDIMTLYRLLRNYNYTGMPYAQRNEMISKFVFTVNTVEGTYALKMNSTEFLATMNTIVNDPIKFERFNRILTTQQKNRNPEGNKPIFQKQLIEFLGEFNLSTSLSLYEANEDLTGWSKITKDSTNNIKYENCE